jgi:hypothetical protein
MCEPQDILRARFRAKYRAMKQKELLQQLMKESPWLYEKDDDLDNLYDDRDLNILSARYRVAIYSLDGNTRLFGQTVFSEEMGTVYGWEIIVDDNMLMLPIIKGSERDAEKFDQPGSNPSFTVRTSEHIIKCWRCT